MKRFHFTDDFTFACHYKSFWLFFFLYDLKLIVIGMFIAVFFPSHHTNQNNIFLKSNIFSQTLGKHNSDNINWPCKLCWWPIDLPIYVTSVCLSRHETSTSGSSKEWAVKGILDSVLNMSCIVSCTNYQDQHFSLLKTNNNAQLRTLITIYIMWIYLQWKKT